MERQLPPMTKEEKVEWDRSYARVKQCDQEIAELTASLKERKNKRYRRRCHALAVNKL
jgi:peptidoglycan hydrolase CwlO-like protein